MNRPLPMVRRSPNKLFFSHALILLTLTVTASAVAGPILPLGQPEYAFVYDRLERTQTLQPVNYNSRLRPYRLDDLEISTGPFDQWLTVADQKVGLFLLAAEDFSTARYVRGNGYETIRGGLVGHPMSNWSVYADFVLSEELADDPNYLGKKWRGVAGNINQAFVTYERHDFRLMLGRLATSWGSPGSFLLSPDQKMDGVAWQLAWGKLTISYRLAALDGLNPDVHNVFQFEPRYFAAHRFDFRVCPKLALGLFETVVFGGPGRQIDLAYLNPVIFFHGTQLNQNLNDNSTVGLDFELLPLEAVRLWGQIQIDDIQLDNESRGDKEPDEYALTVGGYAADLIGQFDLRLQYTKVTNWTFNQMYDRNRYLNDGRPLGALLGNDYDLIQAKLIRWFSDRFSSSLRLNFYRQGEGAIDAEWTEPWVEAEGDYSEPGFDAEGNYSEPFPTGIVEKTTTIALGARGFVADRAFIEFEAGINQIKNLDHLAGENRDIPFARIYLSLFHLFSANLD